MYGRLEEYKYVLVGWSLGYLVRRQCRGGVPCSKNASGGITLGNNASPFAIKGGPLPPRFFLFLMGMSHHQID
jgi:hypothetical protein